MKKLEDMAFTREQIDYIHMLLERRREKTHRAFFDRYKVNSLEELDNRIKLLNVIVEKNKAAEKNKKTELDICLSDINDLIGLEDVKLRIKRLVAYNKKNQTIKKVHSMNYLFVGNPGTGKTETARMFAKELYKNGIIKQEKVVEVDRSGLVAEWIGQTGPKVKRVFEEALGGVLFIDEAYTLKYTDEDIRDFAGEALAELNKQMEDHRGEIVVIFAGYKKETMDMIKSNRGLKSRINAVIEFPDYTEPELRSVANLILKKNNYQITQPALEQIITLVYSNKDKKEYGNARDVRTILDEVFEIQAYRTIDNPSDRVIELVDVYDYQIEHKRIIESDLLKNMN